MPLYRHTLTGKIQAMSPSALKAFAPNTFEEVSPETAAEAAERMRLEALKDKVDLEVDEEDVAEYLNGNEGDE